ncbi:hypothetical protein DUNSADRAFT_17072 [Dunaliella salina]|uniref:Uncharacterized protein n=1 Tax=Dunaliella salina TaxID=3046 RepID=A0ABQ7G2H5_DUNSA|nr:hypothetical protein DUNSADRAFT_17072 [Dunaliella salina]|eukprot:KAF5828793.1 hypothetical protein DUNSADRAFT_17072 [Dunaliella salina]
MQTTPLDLTQRQQAHARASTSSSSCPLVHFTRLQAHHQRLTKRLWQQGPPLVCRAAPTQGQQQQQQEQPEQAVGVTDRESQGRHVPASRSPANEWPDVSDESDDEQNPLASILDEGEEGQSPQLAALTVLGLGLLVGGGYFFRDQIKDFLQYFIQSLRDMGPAGYVAYAVVYAVLELLALPAIPLTMTAGLVFGGIGGTVVVSIAATAAATVAFLIARYVARDKVR